MVKKFHAHTTRDALRMVRDALGANAIILSNRQVDGGVEIIAVADLDMAALAEQAEPVFAPRRPAPASQPAPAQPAAARPAPAQRQEPIPELTTLADFLAQREGSVIRPAPARKSAAEAAVPAWHDEPAQAIAPPPPVPAAAPAAEGPVMQELAHEMRMLRSLVEGQLAGLAWNDACRREPQRAEIMKQLMSAGFSPALTRQVLDRMPTDQDSAHALRWVQAAIVKNLKVAAPIDDLIERGGVYALVGPTGVGKTTTVAKLAARAVLKHGANKVAMITTDSYRIGAQDQLRIYGRILGAPVYVVRDESDLELTLLDLAGKHLVFIDTIGMSQKDRRVGEQTEMLSGQNQGVQRLLLLGAPAQGITLEEVVRSYSGPGLAGCILTKIDEAQTYGPALDVMIRHQLPIHYVTNGQRVPEDMHLANARYLVDRAFRPGAAGAAFVAEDDDYPVLMAAAEARAPDERYSAQGAYGAAA
ncbi:MAG: flagellar biosynthesis protein FlhF [Gallionellaceae bacterium]|nr:flagellar biosynthesis protein FlhF [Gallionellaceae bacterium]MDD5364507.1 flagellar biosynthesis protein FlhF [Gallionellaceae bacterium]